MNKKFLDLATKKLKILNYFHLTTASLITTISCIMSVANNVTIISRKPQVPPNFLVIKQIFKKCNPPDFKVYLIE